MSTQTSAIDLGSILRNARTIAVVGMSDEPHRDSSRIGKMLIDHGYKVYPVNPTIEEVFGIPTYPDLKSLPESVDIVNVFRNPRYAEQIVQDSIEIGAPIVWFQLGAEHAGAIQMGRKAGLTMISGHCIGVELKLRGIYVTADGSVEE